MTQKSNKNTKKNNTICVV